MKKRLVALLLTLTMAASYLPVMAAEEGIDPSDASQVPMTMIPETDFFKTKGDYHSENAMREWMAVGLPEARAQMVLKGNYAFVTGSDYYWSIDHREKASNPAIYNESEQAVILAEVAQKLFGIKLSKTYVTPEEITKAAPQWQSFTDPRGFILFSKDISKHVNLAKPDNEDVFTYTSYYDVSFAIGEITWEDVHPTAEDWATARENIINAWTYYPGTEEKYADYITEAIEGAAKLMEKVDRSPGATLPFMDSTLIDSLSNTRTLGRAYQILKRSGRTELDKEEVLDAVLYALDMLFENYIGQNVSLDNNWFLNRITDPQILTLVMLFVYDELPEEKRNEYCNILFIRTVGPHVQQYVIPYEATLHPNHSNDKDNVAQSFTNLFWTTVTVMQLCLVAENESRMNHCFRYLNLLFDQPVSSGHSELPWLNDGFFEDGSFKYHPNFAYNHGYGKSLLVCLADTMHTFNGTCFDLKDIHGSERLYSWAEWGWLPFIHANNSLKLVMGREGPTASANSPIKALMQLALYSDSEEVKEKYAKLLKPLVDESYGELKNAKSASTYPNFYWPALNESVDEYLEYIHDMPPVEAEPYNHSYYNMDRFVHRRNDYTFMLAMSSERIGKWEAINDGGYSDWFLSDGMTYTLKSNDQYVGRWWNFVDKYAIPGTTVGSDEQRVGSVNYFTNVEANNSWAGGVSDDNLGVAAMKYPTISNHPSNVEATKSWFMLEDMIVCLGTDITAGTGELTTTIENLISYDKAPEEVTDPQYTHGYTRAYVDGEEYPFVFDTKTYYENPKWAWAEGDRGFLFLGENNISVERPAQTKRYSGNSGPYNEEARQWPYLTIRAHHGVNPPGATYGYVLLPAKTMEETAALSENPGFTVEQQDSKAHIIRLADGTVMANLFEPAELEGFRFVNPCAVIIKPVGEGYEVHISEPTQRLDAVKVGLPGNGAVSGNFTTVADGLLTLDVSVNYGRSYDFTYGLAAAGASEIVVSDQISVQNLKLAMRSTAISTKLTAISLRGESLTYSIVGEPQNGKAYLVGDRVCYFLFEEASTPTDTITVQAEDESGNVSQFTVDIEFR